MNVATFVMPQVSASSMRSVCIFPIIGKFAIARGSILAGIVIAQLWTLVPSCCSMRRMPARCASRRARSPAVKRLSRRVMSSLRKSSTLLRSAMSRASCAFDIPAVANMRV